MDIWDGDQQTGPIVTHGHTFCGEITLERTLRAINSGAFLNSEYVLLQVNLI